MRIENVYLNVIDVMAVPCCVEKFVAEPQDQDVLDHLLTKVVVDPEDLFLLPIGVQGLLKVPRALEIFSERLFDLAGGERAIS